MFFAQTSTSFTLIDLLGRFQMMGLFTSVLLSLVFCVIAVVRCNYRILVMPPVLALSISLFMLGMMYLDAGVSSYSLGLDYASVDPLSKLLDAGVMQASIGANLLSLAVSGGMLFLSCLFILIHKRKKG